MGRPIVTTLQAHPDNVGAPVALAEMLNRIQQTVYQALQYIYGLPTTRGQSLVKNVTLGTSAVQVSHGLGRPVQGWIVVRSNATVTVKDDGSMDNSIIGLTASGAATVNILFF